MSMIDSDKLGSKIAGHSNYHGDDILCAIYCMAEGKEIDTIKPVDNNGSVRYGRWIPCSERLPEHKEARYWICTDTGYQCECRWTDNRFGIGNLSGEWGWLIFDTPQYSKVAAWMPLPEPYREVIE